MSKRALIVTLLGVVVVVATVGIVLFRSTSFSPLFKAGQPSPGAIGSTIIAKVGEENIYQTDLNYELANHPQADEQATRGIIIQKMINDSIILQGAKAENLVPVESDIFNTPAKDYPKRVATVEAAKKAVENKSERLSGAVIAIWFRNNHYIGPQGLEKSKQIAFDKISALQKEIKAGKITIDQAGQKIIDDQSLSEIDKAWTNNAIFHFAVSESERITFSSQFDTILRGLKTGEVSDVYLARNVDTDPSERYEALYYVGEVTERANTGNKVTFDDWMAAKIKEFKVTIYE